MVEEGVDKFSAGLESQQSYGIIGIRSDNFSDRFLFALIPRGDQVN